MTLVTLAYRSNGYILFRWHSWRAPIAASKRRKDIYEERTRETVTQGVREKYLVRLTGEEREHALGALVLAGYVSDERSPRWLSKELFTIASRLTESA